MNKEESKSIYAEGARRIGALEAGGTKMVIAVLNEHGTILDRQSLPTRTPEETLPEIIRYFKEKQIDSLGIASFGPVDVNKASETYGHILMTPKLAWRHFDLLGTLKKALNVPMVIDTDVNGSAIGEFCRGAAKDVNSCVYLTLGTGAGIGVIVDGKPLHGALHPEGGHIILKKKEGDCFKGFCPSHGDRCLEGLASGPAIEARWGLPAFALTDRPEVWETISYYIAQALVNYILILSPEKIILGGGVMKQTQLFPLVREKVTALLNGYIDIPQLKNIDEYIVAPGLTDDQALLGCLSMVLDM